MFKIVFGHQLMVLSCYSKSFVLTNETEKNYDNYSVPILFQVSYINLLFSSEMFWVISLTISTQ